MKDFVHLHVHSEYSLLDGYAATGAIARRAADLGMDSIALTDHGVMYGIVEFHEAAKKAGIKPIIGVEAYMAVDSHTDRSPNKRTPGGKQAYHTLLLAKDYEGYQNLVKLTTRAHLDGFYYKPRIDHDLLAQHKEGLIVTSACLAGEINEHLRNGQKEKARAIAAWYRDMLGPDNYYLELQLHPTLPILEELNEELVRMGKELGIPLIATNDAHFVRREDAESQQLIRALGYNTTLRELQAKESQLDDSYYIMSGEEMWEQFKQYGTEPLENTRAIADRCTLNLDFGRVKLPEFAIPEGHDAASYLRVVCEEGLMERFNGHPPEEYVTRLAYELDVINQTGFPDYMLIVWDYVRFARSRNIPCLPRGSAGASLVLYCLGITDVDPVANKLLFERFLSPERLEMPDIDTDFADNRRHEVIEYIANKYGRENTAQIITYGTLGAKAAIRDMGRVLDVPLSEVDRVARLIPTIPVGTTIAQALERVPELKQIYDTDSKLKEVIDKAQTIEGRMRSVGTHACGLVVSRDPLDSTVPLQPTRDQTSLMASYEGPTLAKVGLLKMDILGLTNLSVVAEALNYIERSTGKRLELADIPRIEATNPDGTSNGVARTFEFLSNGGTTNVFQFESAGMTRYLKELKPTRVEDLFAMVALYRPGPLEQIPTYIRNKNNPKEISYLHPILEPILSDTYGVIVYQEQIMQLLQAIAGYSLGQAYIVLKAIGKKKRDLMAKEEPRFKEGCLKNGLSKEQADTLWDLIQPFAGYSFNRPHSTLYGLLSYQTAYLKVNYPTEYMAAVLTAAAGNTEEVAKSVVECGQLGVVVLPPDVNHSNHGFTIEDLAPDHPAIAARENGALPQGAGHTRAIRFGLSAIKNVGAGPIELILAAREAGGRFLSLEDFCARVDRNALNRRVLESLIKSGAMDILAGTRHQQLDILDKAIAAGLAVQEARDVGQASMFDAFATATPSEKTSVQAIPLPDRPETPEGKKEEMEWEKEMLGLYISEHPVAQALQAVDTSGTIPLNTINEAKVGVTGTFIGMVSGVRRITTKKGKPMLVATLGDLYSTIDIVAFPDVLEKYADQLYDDAVVRVVAKIDNRRGDTQLIIGECLPVELLRTQPGDSLSLQPEMDIEAMGDSQDDGQERRIEVMGSEQRHADTPEPLAPTNGQHTPASAEPTHSPMPNGTASQEQSGSGLHQSTGREYRERSEQGEHTMKNTTPPGNTGGYFRHRPRVNVSSNGSNGASNGHNNRTNGASNGSNGADAGTISEQRTPYAASQSPAASSEAQTETPKRSLRLRLVRSRDEDAMVRQMQQVDDVLRARGGSDEVLIYVPNGNGTAVLRPNYGVNISPDLLQQLEHLLGEGRVLV
jgi:DNA polymerase-3 subunit alpha